MQVSATDRSEGYNIYREAEIWYEMRRNWTKYRDNTVTVDKTEIWYEIRRNCIKYRDNTEMWRNCTKYRDNIVTVDKTEIWYEMRRNCTKYRGNIVNRNTTVTFDNTQRRKQSGNLYLFKHQWNKIALADMGATREPPSASYSGIGNEC